MAGFTRQLGGLEQIESPNPFPEELMERLYDLALERVEAVDGNERETLEKIFLRRENEWKRWEHRNWDVGFAGQNAGSALLRTAGAWISAEDALICWATPRSMRNVDAEARVEITRQYMHGRDDT
jgi:hypothetical protein